MNKIFTALLLLFLASRALGQTGPTAQPYGTVDKADLEMKECDFEKDANAEVLFDKADISFDNNFHIVVERHKRIKIFNDHGKDYANIRLEFYGRNQVEGIYDVQAETINLNNGLTEITRIDKKLIYTETVDKWIKAVVFSFPNVKAGSIIEFKYSQQNSLISDFPAWFFQSDMPTRYSEFSCTITDVFHYRYKIKANQPFVKNVLSHEGQPADLVMVNVPSLRNEPFMSSRRDNLQSIIYQLVGYTPRGGFTETYADTWKKIAGDEAEDSDFGGQFNSSVSGEDEIIAKAKTLGTNEGKIAYIFNEVKTAMKWNGVYRSFANDGTSRAWDKKLGNSTEINLIINHLLNKSGVTAYPILLSTHANGKVDPGYPSIYQFNTSATFVRIDSANYYVLDATSKYGSYKEIPTNVLNSFGLVIDKRNKKYEILFIEKAKPARKVISITADIKPNGKMEGTAQMSSFSYFRANSVEAYKTDGEKKYTDNLTGNDNTFKITSLKFENMEVDTLPLVQNIEFNMDLTGSDETYIYFKPSLLTANGANPFLSENRVTDVDYGYRQNLLINGSFKIPAGYKSDALPKSASMTMPDQSITFKRVVGEQDGTIVVRYLIDFKKSIFLKETYPDLYDFYKKMYEMLNEQIVLKKI